MYCIVFFFFERVTMYLEEIKIPVFICNFDETQSPTEMAIFLQQLVLYSLHWCEKEGWNFQVLERI